MNCKWTISGHHLCIEDDKQLLHPSAAEIYSLIDGEEIDGITIENPSTDFPDLKFSRLGSPIYCKVYTDASSGVICLTLYTVRNKTEISIDMVDGYIIDHCLAENEWFYLTGDSEHLSSILSNAGIRAAGEINIQQYLNLRKENDIEQDILFEINSQDIKKSEAISQLIPQSLNAKLYPYQKIGFSWMKSMIADCGGCILGDEMGLGKTLQVITLFLEKRGNRLLVIAPVSLLENWKQECKKFAPTLKTYIHHGSKRTGRYLDLVNYDVIIISYNTAVSDASLLKMINWDLVVIDEAQNIKNPHSNRARAVKAIPRKSSIAVSGTPFENHIVDIWSLVDFVLPGLLGDLSSFTKTFSDDQSGAEKIEPILSPIMLRRLVKDVANDLPEKVIIPQPLTMPESEAFQYEKIRESIVKNTDPSVITLAALQKLRMFCTFPSLYEAYDVKDPTDVSLKYQRFCEIIEEILSRKEKAIVFTSYKKMFEIFDKDIPKRFNVPIWNINGETPVDDRQKIVDAFNEFPTSAVLALNPRAAGTGLNITGANHVIHFNLEWNPALEDQASARAYRRGQKKTVFVYRLYYLNTVEELVNERISRKREIAKTAIVGNEGMLQERKDLIAAINVSPIFK